MENTLCPLQKMNSEQSKKRICIYCDLWESGGIESFIFNTVSRMNLSGLEIEIVVAEIGESIFRRPLEAHGVRFIELSGNKRRFIKNHRLFGKLLKEKEYSTVHINAFQGVSLYCLHLAKKNGIERRIVHSHNSDLRKSALKNLKKLLHKAYSALYANDATDLWACSKLAAEFLYPKKVLNKRGYAFVPNAVDVEKFRFDAAAREKIHESLGIRNRFILGNVGRLCDQKNQIFLLDVVAELEKRGYESLLLLIGAGPDQRKLAVRAKELNITDHVVFSGVSSHVAELLSAIDAFVFPSLFEGLPISVIEAQASGLPVLYHEKLAEEAAILPNFIFLPLEINSWVEAILKTERNENREEAANMMKQTMFDLSALSEWLEKEYRGE